MQHKQANTNTTSKRVRSPSERRPICRLTNSGGQADGLHAAGSLRSTAIGTVPDADADAEPDAEADDEAVGFGAAANCGPAAGTEPFSAFSRSFCDIGAAVAAAAGAAVPEASVISTSLSAI